MAALDYSDGRPLPDGTLEDAAIRSTYQLGFAHGEESVLRQLLGTHADEPAATEALPADLEEWARDRLALITEELV